MESRPQCYSLRPSARKSRPRAPRQGGSGAVAWGQLTRPWSLGQTTSACITPACTTPRFELRLYTGHSRGKRVTTWSDRLHTVEHRAPVVSRLRYDLSSHDLSSHDLSSHVLSSHDLSSHVLSSLYPICPIYALGRLTRRRALASLGLRAVLGEEASSPRCL